KVELTVRREDTLLAELAATVDAPIAALQDQEVVGHVPFTFKARGGPVPLKTLQGLAGPPPPGTGPVTGQQNMQGILSLELAARGTLDDPTLELAAGLQQLGVRQFALGQARFHYAYDDARSVLDALLTSPNGGTLLVKGQAQQELSLPALQRGVAFALVPLDVDIDAQRFDLSFLSGSQLPMVRTLGGMLQADAHVGGTVGAPTYRGDFQWKDGQLALEGYGEYRDIQVALDVNDNHLNLSQLSVRSGGGSLSLTAQADRTKAGHFALTGQGEMKDFPLVSDDQLIATLTLRTTLEGEVSNQLVNLRNLAIPEAHINLPEARRKDIQSLDRPEGIVLVRNGVPLEKRKRKKGTPAAGTEPGSAMGGAGTLAAAEEAQRQYWVNVNAPKNLWVHGSDVNAEIGLSENFRVEYEDETTINGTVKVLRGELEVMGRRFNVQDSSFVRFTGPARTPYINAVAEHDNERAGVKVFVTIRGQGKDFTIKPTSEPPLPETEIYTLLATGRRTLRAGSGASMNQGQVASVLGSLLASQARKALAAKLPLDVFSIEAGEEGLTDARLEVGKYLTDELYLGYSGRLGTPQNQSTTRRENNAAVRLEYQFSPRWGLEVEYGD
ncbi:MAG TPA: translocation/assembly module TamB domain-containing protein, partial [Myxococcaceae bacterium]|nr:translocation/assembly module TamB domain-containing protein [Myxococcaceae bacterium]